MPPKTSGKAAKKAGKAAKSISKRDGKKKRKSRKESYSIYFYKVLKQVHPNITNLWGEIKLRDLAYESRIVHYIFLLFGIKKCQNS